MYEPFLGVNPWTALFVLLNTLTVYFAGKKYLFGPVMDLIDQRKSEIEMMYNDAAASRQNAEAMERISSARLSDAHAAGDRIVKEAVTRAKHREEEILRQAGTQARAILDQAAADALTERKRAIADARDEIAGLSISIAEKVVERQLNDADQQRLVHDFLRDLEDTL